MPRNTNHVRGRISQLEREVANCKAVVAQLEARIEELEKDKKPKKEG